MTAAARLPARRLPANGQFERPGLTAPSVERAGPFDPLATFQLPQFEVSFVPVTKGQELLKVIDRVGVATQFARTAVEWRLGRG